MTKARACDRLAAANPGGLSRNERESILSRVVSSPPPMGETPWDMPPWLKEPRRLHRRRAVIGGVAATVVVAAGLPVALSAADRGGATEVRLASYSFKLPNGYRQAQPAADTCDAGNMVSWAVGSFGGVQPMRNIFNDEPDEPGIVSAADASGGCVSMALIGPFTPGGPLTPTVEGIGGPLSPAGTSNAQSVMVGPYEALLGTLSTDSGASATASAKARETAGQSTRDQQPAETVTTELVLDVTIPATDGQVDNLLVSSTQLSQQELISVVTQGLTGG